MEYPPIPPQRVFGTAAIRYITGLSKDASSVVAKFLIPSARYMLAMVFKVHRIIDADTVKCFLTIDRPAFYQILGWRHSFNGVDIEKYDAVNAITTPSKIVGRRSLLHLMSSHVTSFGDLVHAAIQYGCTDVFDIVYDGMEFQRNIKEWKLPLDRTRMIPNYLKYSHLIIANGGPDACAIIAELEIVSTTCVLASFHHLETLQAMHAHLPMVLRINYDVNGAFDNATVPMLEWFDATIKPDWTKAFATGKNRMDAFEWLVAHDAKRHSTTLYQDAWLHDNHIHRRMFDHFHTLYLPMNLYQWVWDTFNLSQFPKQNLIYELQSWATARGYYGLVNGEECINQDIDSVFKKYLATHFKPRLVILCLRKPAVRCLRACMPYIATLPLVQASLLREQIRMHSNPAISSYADL
jgi:hypothetical protein